MQKNMKAYLKPKNFSCTKYIIAWFQSGNITEAFQILNQGVDCTGSITIKPDGFLYKVCRKCGVSMAGIKVTFNPECGENGEVTPVVVNYTYINQLHGHDDFSKFITLVIEGLSYGQGLKEYVKSYEILLS